MELQKIVDALIGKGYEVSCFETAEEAASYLDRKVDGKTVGFGDSITLDSMKLYQMLSAHNQVIDPMHCASGMDFRSTAKQSLTTDEVVPTLDGAIWRARNIAAPQNAARHGFQSRMPLGRIVAMTVKARIESAAVK